MNTTDRAVSRTPEVIAGEINEIKSRTNAILGAAFTTARVSCFEIGRRLEEAKCLVPHGAWGQWLAENVNYSESTANNLMRIFREYGSEQIDMFTGKSDREIFEGLSQSQLVALFAIPAPERAAYVQTHREELEGGQSIRELEAQIREYKAKAEEAAEQARVAKAREQEMEQQTASLRKRAEAAELEVVDYGKMRADLEQAQQRILAFESTPERVQEVTVTVHQPTPEQEQAIREEEREECQRELEEMKRLNQERVKEVLEKADTQAAEYEKQLARLRAQSDIHAQRISMLLTDVARCIGAVADELAAMDAEESGTGAKMKRRVEATLGKLLDQKGIEV